MRSCPNNCSNTFNETFGTCVQDYPYGYCKCHEWKRRGGDDCSITFCLNDCSGRGTCIDGVCKCKNNFFGEDCSIFVIPIIFAKHIVASLTLILSICAILYLL